VFEDEEMEFVPEAPKLNRLISLEEEMYAEWPKLVTSVLSLRTQLVAFSAIKANSDAGVAELLSGLDDKLAILKGLIGASPHLDSVVAELGVDIFLVLDGLAGTVHHSKSLLSQSLKEMQVQLATLATCVAVRTSAFVNWRFDFVAWKNRRRWRKNPTGRFRHLSGSPAFRNRLWSV